MKGITRPLPATTTIPIFIIKTLGLLASNTNTMKQLQPQPCRRAVAHLPPKRLFRLALKPLLTSLRVCQQGRRLKIRRKAGVMTRKTMTLMMMAMVTTTIKGRNWLSFIACQRREDRGAFFCLIVLRRAVFTYSLSLVGTQFDSSLRRALPPRDFIRLIVA